jgi:hypothetical protein
MAEGLASSPEVGTEGMAADGRVPFVFRIGVTGHRTLEEDVSLHAAIQEALERLKQLLLTSVQTPVVLVVVSSLAEGADRLVAREVLAESSARLEAALPLPPDDYMRDFPSETSKQEFRQLLDGASVVWQAPPSSDRDSAYEIAGRYVVDRSDAVIAVWDGETPRGQGGTADVVRYARHRAVPLLWIDASGEHAITEQLEATRVDVLRDAARGLDAYNRARISATRLSIQSAQQRERWALPERAVEEGLHDPLFRQEGAGRLLPNVLRADILALRFQRVFNALSSAVFVLASLAVAIVATQEVLFPEELWMISLEVLVLLCLLAIPWLNRRWQLHDRWISYRFLAERLRSCYFLALAGTGDRGEKPGRLAYFSDPSEEWIARTLREVAIESLPMQVDVSRVPSLSTYLANHWIQGQIDYHRQASCRQGVWDKRLIRSTEVLFGVTLIAALAHMLGVGHHSDAHWAEILILISISVPVIGASAHGIATQRQFRRHSERYERMVRLLEQLHGEMKVADSLEEVQRVAVETERIMREENSDWFGVVRFHDMELIT